MVCDRNLPQQLFHVRVVVALRILRIPITVGVVQEGSGVEEAEALDAIKAGEASSLLDALAGSFTLENWVFALS